jgi:hypothetical protein
MLKKITYKSTDSPYSGGKDRETEICPYCGSEGHSEFISGFIYTYKLDEGRNIVY